MYDEINSALVGFGITEWLASIIAYASSFLTTAVIVIVTYFIIRWLITRYAATIVGRTNIKWDDYLEKHRVFDSMAWIIPAFVFYWLLPFTFEGRLPAFLVRGVIGATQITLVGLFVLTLNRLISAVRERIENSSIANQMPVASFTQLFRIVLYIFGFIIVLSVLLSEQPLIVMSSFGAFAAVLSFVYQDALRGLVAGIQLTWNNMLAIGDWIEMPSFDVSGTVMEIGLTTVKIQNFDYSITAVPTYALISDSLKNWQGMLESEGRRMIHSIYIDASTIHFCDDTLIERLKTLDIIRHFIEQHQNDISLSRRSHNRTHTEYNPANDQLLTNLNAFRQYIFEYARQHPKVNANLTLIVSILPQTAQGVPIQVLAFSREKGYADFVDLQNEIFDHLMAVVDQFELRLYQSPTGNDIQVLSQSIQIEPKGV